ncbi:hypothetical protein OOZ15_19025 [Galbibacter sp. EGI 63066]|uniref:hypothetical protein n=1 Tax=Galbibacter sp. EGI 63066 TaxID=2993559 RepID=UPI002248AF4D|nr:hypothetical protein [Galbibacter sp. EGI 63066]MCX2682052.1 hypothetical protein [Galbibacter sp. EGI 63066]
MILEIFKTNVLSEKQSIWLLKVLQLYFSDCIMNFDLEDCDRILRVEANREIADQITAVMVSNGFFCERIL